MFVTDLTAALDPESRVFWQHLGTALLCGGMIGIERQLRGKAAGIRTSILICLGTSVFVSLGAATGATNVDPTRVLAQITSGIGFVGGGVILARKGLVTGVTTAAVIWVLAALGAPIGSWRASRSSRVDGGVVRASHRAYHGGHRRAAGGRRPGGGRSPPRSHA